MIALSLLFLYVAATSISASNDVLNKVPMPPMGSSMVVRRQALEASSKSCGLLQLGIYCPRHGECGFIQNILKLNGCKPKGPTKATTKAPKKTPVRAPVKAPMPPTRVPIKAPQRPVPIAAPAPKPGPPVPSRPRHQKKHQ
jgi:hypothetical protein